MPGYLENSTKENDMKPVDTIFMCWVMPFYHFKDRSHACTGQIEGFILEATTYTGKRRQLLSLIYAT